MIKGKLFPLENIPDKDYAEDASYASDAYEATHFTSSTLMKLAQAYSVKANLSDIAIILSQTTFSSVFGLTVDIYFYISNMIDKDKDP